MANNCFQLTVKSVIFFAIAKKPPLFTSAEAGVRKRELLMVELHDLDNQIKELERDRKIEELRQLKQKSRAEWITPGVMTALLPLVGGFCLWVYNEIKQYNEGYQALKEKQQLIKEKSELLREKDSLNVEIQTLVILKEHYAKEAKEILVKMESKQHLIDKLYLRAHFYNFDTQYMLGMGLAYDDEEEHNFIDYLNSNLDSFQKPNETRELLENYQILKKLNSYNKCIASVCNS